MPYRFIGRGTPEKGQEKKIDRKREREREGTARPFNRGENVFYERIDRFVSAREALCNMEFWRIEAIDDQHLRSRLRYVGVGSGNGGGLKFAN